MIRSVIRLRKKRVLIDVDTQRDFFVADGADCVRNHRRVLANIRRVMAWSRLRGVRVISTTRATSDDNAGVSRQKLSYTLKKRHIEFEADGCTDLPRDLLQKYEQVILDKRCENPFNEPRADRILSELNADEFLIIGQDTEGAVKATVLGLLARGKNVVILTDAIGHHNKDVAEISLRQMNAKGAKLVDFKSLVGGTHLKKVGACSCDRCQGKMQKVAAS
jgi:nicotinamidase-related amidase